MFGKSHNKSRAGHTEKHHHSHHSHSTTTTTTAGGKKSSYANLARDVRLIFLLMLVLSIIELGFTLDSFIYLQRKHKWWSGTERARFCFLIFSCVRTIVLAAVYSGYQKSQKWLHSSLHTIFFVLSTVFWIVSGVLIHHMWGYKECGGVGPAKGGLNECHEIKIIEILAWVIAGVSVLATIPVVMIAMKDHKHGRKSRSHSSRMTEKV